MKHTRTRGHAAWLQRARLQRAGGHALHAAARRQLREWGSVRAIGLTPSVELGSRGARCLRSSDESGGGVGGGVELTDGAVGERVHACGEQHACLIRAQPALASRVAPEGEDRSIRDEGERMSATGGDLDDGIYGVDAAGCELPALITVAQLPVSPPPPAPEHSPLRYGEGVCSAGCDALYTHMLQRGDRPRDGEAALVAVTERALPAAAARIHDARAAQEQAVQVARSDLDA